MAWIWGNWGEAKPNYADIARSSMMAVQQLASTESETPLQINLHQCRYLSEKFSEVASDQSWSLSSTKGELDSVLKELCRIVKDAETLVRDCCKQSWLKAAIMLVDSRENFASILFKFEWCTTLVRFGAHRNRKGLQLNDVVSKCELKMNSIYSSINNAANLDRDVLRSKLELVLRQSGAVEEWALADNLLQSLQESGKSGDMQRHWIVDPDELCLGGELGSGINGQVCETTWLGDVYARKDFVGVDNVSFKKEAANLAGLWHPHIVSMVCCSVDEKREKCTIVMQLMKTDLSRVIKRLMHSAIMAPFDLPIALDILLQIAQGMKYLHDKKMAHRDLKPSNILLNPVLFPKLAEEGYWHAKVGDFGLAKTNETNSTSDHTLNTGTRRWMAPELYGVANVHSNGRVRTNSFKADVYSYGMTSYEIMSGKMPFQSCSMTEVKRRIEDGERPELPSSCPKCLITLIQKCWNGDPAKRPSFVSICEELRRFKSVLLIGGEKCLRELKDSTPKERSSISCESISERKETTQNGDMRQKTITSLEEVRDMQTGSTWANIVKRPQLQPSSPRLQETKSLTKEEDEEEERQKAPKGLTIRISGLPGVINHPVVAATVFLIQSLGLLQPEGLEEAWWAGRDGMRTLCVRFATKEAKEKVMLQKASLQGSNIHMIDQVILPLDKRHSFHKRG